MKDANTNETVPEPLSQEDAERMIDDFFAKMCERHGVKSLLVCWRTDEGSYYGGGIKRKGDWLTCYGMAKKFVAQCEKDFVEEEG